MSFMSNATRVRDANSRIGWGTHLAASSRERFAARDSNVGMPSDVRLTRPKRTLTRTRARQFEEANCQIRHSDERSVHLQPTRKIFFHVSDERKECLTDETFRVSIPIPNPT